MEDIQQFPYPVPYAKGNPNDLLLYSVLGFEHENVQGKASDIPTVMRTGFVRPVLTHLQNLLVAEQSQPGEEAGTTTRRPLDLIEPRYSLQLDYSQYGLFQAGSVWSPAVVASVPKSREEFLRTYIGLGAHADISESTVKIDPTKSTVMGTRFMGPRIRLIRRPGKEKARGIDALVLNVTEFNDFEDALDQYISVDRVNNMKEGAIEYLKNSANLPLTIYGIEKSGKKVEMLLKQLGARHPNTTFADQILHGTTRNGKEYAIPIIQVCVENQPTWNHFIVPYSTLYDEREHTMEGLGHALLENLANRHVQTKIPKNELEARRIREEARAQGLNLDDEAATTHEHMPAVVVKPNVETSAETPKKITPPAPRTTRHLRKRFDDP